MNKSIVVRKIEGERFILIDGCARYLALVQLGIKTVEIECK
jgi:ParB-like chromosome segregation protein Spo0J